MYITHLPYESGVYMIHNIINKKSYIGYSNNIHRRCREHRCNLDNNANYNDKMQNEWNTSNYGFVCTVLELTNDSEREKYWIEKYDSINTGYNYISGGKLDVTHSKESKEKIKQVNLGKIYPEKLKQKIKLCTQISKLKTRIDFLTEIGDHVDSFLINKLSNYEDDLQELLENSTLDEFKITRRK